MNDLRCKKCGKKLGAGLEGRVAIVCPRCGVFNQFEGLGLTNTTVSDNVKVKS